MRELQAYALAAILLIIAPASEAGLPPQNWIDRDVRLTPPDRVVPHEVASNDVVLDFDGRPKTEPYYRYWWQNSLEFYGYVVKLD